MIRPTRDAEPVLNRWLATPTPRLVGKYSYSLYLWHWPLLVIPEAAAGRPMSAWERVGLVAIAVIVSVITFHLVENPLRYIPFLATSKARSLLLGVSLIAVALLSTTTLPAKGTTKDIEKQAADVLPPKLAAAVAKAPNDSGKAAKRGCQHGLGSDISTDPIDPTRCMFGAVDDESAPLVMLLGDSHASSWHPAVEKIADQAGWRLLTLTKSTCPFEPTPVYNEYTKTHYTDCDNWRIAVTGIIDEMKPAMVILAGLSEYYSHTAVQAGEEVWLKAMGDIVAQLSTKTHVVVLQDVPYSPTPIPACILRSKGKLDTCDFQPTELFIALSDAERTVTQNNGGTYVNTLPIVCPNNECVAAVGNIVTYMDTSHMTAAFSKSIAGPLGAELKPLLPR